MANDHPRTLTLEDAQKGARAKSPFKSMARSLGSRRKCSPSCMYFEICPVCAMSYGFKDPNHPENDRKCMMREFPLTVRQQFTNLFLTGEEGMIHEIKLLMHSYLNDVEAYGNLRDKKDSIQLMITLYDKIYNSTRKTVGGKEPLTITIRRVGMEPEAIEIMPRSQFPEGMNLKTITAPQNADITEGDKESLINSDLLDKIVRIEPKARPMYMEEIKIESNFEKFLEDND